jgi:methyl-accepting chemotaxis protein
MTLRLKQKIVGLAILAALLPITGIVINVAVQKAATAKIVNVELDQLVQDNLNRVALDVYGSCSSSNQVLLSKLDNYIAFTKEFIDLNGGINLSSENVSWDATNTASGRSQTISIPKMNLGDRWLGKETSASNYVPIVDDMGEMTNALFSVFQRINDTGDMVRVASNVVTASGNRAVGTLLPVRNSDGGQNPVLAAILSGRDFSGRSFVIDGWYLTKYTPIKNSSGGVIGLIGTALPINALTELREQIMEIGLGKTGYVYVLGGKGDQKGHYVISAGGTRDGEDLMGSKDETGKLFIKEIVEEGVKLGKGQTFYADYIWDGRLKRVSLTYFEEWDWVIGAGAYEDEFKSTYEKVNSALANVIISSLIGGLILLGIMVGLALLIGGRIAKPILKIRDVALEIATGDLTTDIDIHATDEVGDLANAFEDMLVGLRGKEAVAESISAGELDIEIEKASEKDSLGEAMIKVRDRLLSLVSETDSLVKAAIAGRLDTRADHTKFDGEYSNIVKGINMTIETFVGHIDAIPTPVMIIDNDFNMVFMNKAGAAAGNTTNKQLIGQKCYSYTNMGDCNTENCACDRAMKNKSQVNSQTDAHPGGNIDLEVSYSGTPIYDRDGKVVGALEVVMDQTDVVKAQKKSEKISEYQALEVTKLSAVLEKMADGDLTVDYQMADADDDTAETRKSFAGIASAFDRTLQGLNVILGQVNAAIEQVSEGSDQVSQSSQTLSQGATEQAASVEEVSASITTVGAQTKLNADNAAQANKLSTGSRKSAETGNDQMTQMLDAMNDINNSSSEVKKIIKVIDEIAFQTNLLALNAAVEAARAGVHGKGFAVVAEEVRNLAHRSANAAKETTDLIEGSAAKSVRGTEIANGTATSLKEISESITKVTDLISEIDFASREQSTAIDEVSDALNQIDQVTQSNAASAEESAATSEELSGQASHLRELINKFRLTSSSYSSSQVAAPQMQQAALRPAPKATRGSGTGSKTSKKGGFSDGVIRPDDIINLDDEDFGGF